MQLSMTFCEINFVVNFLKYELTIPTHYIAKGSQLGSQLMTNLQVSEFTGSVDIFSLTCAMQAITSNYCFYFRFNFSIRECASTL